MRAHFSNHSYTRRGCLRELICLYKQAVGWTQGTRPRLHRGCQQSMAVPAPNSAFWVRCCWAMQGCGGSRRCQVCAGSHHPSSECIDEQSVTITSKETRKARTGNAVFISSLPVTLGLGLESVRVPCSDKWGLNTPGLQWNSALGLDLTALGGIENTCCFLLAAGEYKINIPKFNLECGYGQRSDCKKASLIQ